MCRLAPGHPSVPVPVVPLMDNAPMQSGAPSLFYRSRLFVGTSIAALALVVLLGLWLQASRSATSELEAMVVGLESSDEKEDLLRQAAARIFEIQGARRGFILTRDEQFLQSFETATRQLEADLNQLKKAFSGRDSDAVQAEVVVLIDLAVEYERQLRSSLALAKSNPQSFDEQQSITLAGEATSRKIHKHLAALQQLLDRDFARDLRGLLGRTHRIESNQVWLAAGALLALCLGYARVLRAGCTNLPPSARLQRPIPHWSKWCRAEQPPSLPASCVTDNLSNSHPTPLFCVTQDAPSFTSIRQRAA